MSSTATHRLVIAAVDGSAASMAAVTWAARDAVTRRVPLTLVHVLAEQPATRWPQPHVSDTRREDEREERGCEILDAAEEAAHQATTDHPVEVKRHVKVGGELRVLVEMSNDAAVVAVGARGQGAGTKPTLGSIAAGLIRHAHCPVAVIHDAIPLTRDSARAPVLLGIDGSFEIGDVELAFAFDEASRRGVGVVALHCWGDHGMHQVSAIDRGRELEKGNEVLSERLVGWERAYPHVALERRLVHGGAADQLLKASQEAQLTVIGGDGWGGVAGYLFGSVDSSVLETVRTPVVIARMTAV